MALIFADDFQQWATASSAQLRGPGIFPQWLGQNVLPYQNEAQCLGIYIPAATQGFGGDNSVVNTLTYDTTKGKLCVCHGRAGVNNNQASGYRKLINYEGDTLYFGLALEFENSGQPAYEFPGNFLFFGNTPGQTVFTSTDGVGNNYLYTVGVDVNGFYTFNGVSTTAKVYYTPATVVAYLDVILGPDYMELWINNVMVSRQARVNLNVKEFAISTSKMITGVNQQFGIYLHSVILADNTEGFGQRIGRKRAKTEQVDTVAITETGQIPPVGSGYIPLGIIRKCATGPTDETNVTMQGSLLSPLPYVKNEFTGVRSATKKPYAAAINIQAKRLYPAGDGLGVHPYVTIAGQKVYGNKVVPSSTWKMYNVGIPIADAQTFSAFNFGYEHDYKDQTKVYAVDRQNTEVYGTEIPVNDQWWRSTDLIAFDSSRIGGSGNFTDFNGKVITSAAGTLPTPNNFPFKASEAFKYGQGVDLNINGALFTPLTGATLAQPHTIDFWFKESVDNAISALLAIYTDTTVTTSYMQLHTHDTQTAKMALWNNNATARIISAWDAFKSSTTWRHYAVTYDGATVSIYIDGVLFGTFTWTILSFARVWGLAHRAYWRQDTASRLIIERYRVRSGVAFTANFDPELIYN
jgi:hypothetical protein